MEKGWYIIPGVQDGDRTLEEQMQAVLPALRECAGKRVLDLGCAEGLMAIEFAKAGAAHVHGMEWLERHLAVAAKMAGDLPNITFTRVHLKYPPVAEPFDIVLCLGVVHKLHDPGPGLRWAMACTNGLLLFRAGLRQKGGVVFSKHSTASVDAHAMLRQGGFTLEKVIRGPKPHEEKVEYWRRTCA